MIEIGQIWKIKETHDGLVVSYVAFPEYLLILEKSSSWPWAKKFNVLTNKSHFDSYYDALITDRYERIL